MNLSSILSRVCCFLSEVIIIKRPIKKLLCILAIAIGVMLFTALPSYAAQTTKLSTPALNAPVSTTVGVQVSWNAVKGAAKYRVFLKSGTSWKKLGDTASTKYTHTAASSGTTYTYTVRCLSKDGKSFTSAFDTKGKSITYIAAPTISSLSNQNNGVKITWNAVKGAAKYRVFLKNSTSWKKLADTASSTLTHTAVTSGQSYTYTVRCLSKDGKSFTSAYYAGKSVTFVQTPKITALTDMPGGVKLTWTPCAGAASYRVYIKSGTAWKVLADVKTNSFIHPAAHNTSYTYTVRCQNAAGAHVSAYNTNGWTHTYLIPAVLNTPVITGFQNLDSGTEIRWDPIDGALKYRVLIKHGGIWNTLGETTDTCYLNTNVTPGQDFTYTVCCISADGKSYLSTYDTVGKSSTYVKAPDIVEIINASNGALLRWGSCEGASGYRIFIQKDGAWQSICDTSETAYLHTDAAVDEETFYMVCCLDKNGNPVSSGHETGVSNRYIPDENTLIYTKAMFAEDVYEILGAYIDNITDHKAPLNRRNASEIIVKSLGYTAHNAVVLSDTDDTNLLTAAYYGYFIPDESDRIFPAQELSESEREHLLEEVRRYEQLKGKHMVGFGDSIVYGRGNNASDFGRMTAEKYGMTYSCYGVSGATFGTRNNYQHIPDETYTAYYAGERPDVILLNGGTNDTHFVYIGSTQDRFDPESPAQSTFASGFEYTMMQIRRYWGDIPVIYVRAHNMHRDPEALERQMGEYGLSIAQKWGAYTVDIYSDTDFNTENDAHRIRYTMYKPALGDYDGIHPTALGYVTYYIPLFSDKLYDVLS